MLTRASGIVVNVSSDSARAPEVGESAYASSKSALAVFSEGVAYELAPRGVNVHVLYPAWVPTAMGRGGDGNLPPRLIRRTEGHISRLVLERMGGSRIDINASRLPLLAVLAHPSRQGSTHEACAPTGPARSNPATLTALHGSRSGL
jgi:NAD(P)-dependent dehydrogenase (short-subunit alcohol dehydrogenase family)